MPAALVLMPAGRPRRPDSPRGGRAIRTLAVLLVLLAGGTGCEEPAGPPPGAAASAPRIASLSPAISRTLQDLDGARWIVGRSRYCDFLDPAITIVGDLQHFDAERLVDLGPSHVFVQAPAAGVDPALARLARDQGWVLRTWSGIDDVEDIRHLVDDLGETLAASGGMTAEERTHLRGRIAGFHAELDDALAPAAAGGWTGPTLLVHQLDPVGVFGAGTYLDDVLVRFGATNAVSAAGWPTLSLEDVVRLNPPAIVLVRPGAAGELTVELTVEAALGPLGRLEIDAIRDGRVGMLRDPDALRPCSRITSVAREMREILVQLAEAGAAGGSP